MKLPCSPYYILTFARKFSLLLFTLPLQTLLMINSALHTKVFFIVADILILSAIILCAYISMQGIKLFAATSRFTLYKGIFHKQVLSVERCKLHSICVSRNLLQRVLGVCKVTLVSSSAKGEIFLSIKHLAHLPCSLPAKKALQKTIFKSKLTDILIMSAGLSPSLGTALSFAPLVRSLSNLSSEEFISSANLWDILGYKAMPPLLASLSSLIILLWVAGVVLSFCRFINLHLCKAQNCLQINRGLLSKHSTAFTPKEARAVVFRQSLIMLFFRRRSSHILLSNEQKNARITIGCTKKLSDSYIILKSLKIQEPHSNTKTTRPSHKALISYTILPLLTLSSLSAFSILISKVSPYKIEPHLGVFLCLWCCVWFLHRCLAFCRTSLSLSGGTLHIRTYSGLSFLDVFIPTENIRCLKTVQNPFQKHKATCNLRVFIRCKNKKAFVIRHISIKKAAELTAELCG